MTRILGVHYLQPSDFSQAAGFLKDKFGQHPHLFTAKSRESQVAGDPQLEFGEFAGPAAHAALLARELGIPCVGGIPEIACRNGYSRVATYRRDDRDTGSGIVNPVSEEARGLLQYRL